MYSFSSKGANASIAAFNLIVTAKANYHDSFDYIEYLLGIMPSTDFIKNPEHLDGFIHWGDWVQSMF